MWFWQIGISPLQPWILTLYQACRDRAAPQCIAEKWRQNRSICLQSPDDLKLPHWSWGWIQKRGQWGIAHRRGESSRFTAVPHIHLEYDAYSENKWISLYSSQHVIRWKTHIIMHKLNNITQYILQNCVFLCVLPYLLWFPRFSLGPVDSQLTSHCMDFAKICDQTIEVVLPWLKLMFFKELNYEPGKSWQYLWK